jgi:hypothetical protein
VVTLCDQELAAIALFDLYDSLVPLLIANNETNSLRFDLINSFRLSKAEFCAIGGVDAADRLNTPMQGVLLRATDQQGLHRICLIATGPLRGGVVPVEGSSRR